MTTFLRRLVSRMQTARKNSSESADGNEELQMLTNGEALDRSLNESTGWTDGRTSRAGESIHSTDSEDEAQLTASAASLDRTLRRKRKALNARLDRYRRERWAVEHKASQVQHLQDEISAMMGMLAQLKKQKSLLKLEKNNKLREIALTCKMVLEDINPELRKKEPLQFKKYHSAKTMADVQSLLQNIHLKQKALEHLEVLTFKKMLEFEHKGLNSLMKNNNNTEEPETVQILITDALAGMELDYRENSPDQDLNTARYLFNSMEVINSFGLNPSSFDNPLFESAV